MSSFAPNPDAAANPNHRGHAARADTRSAPTPRAVRKSPRLAGYDYAQGGMYFVTVCVQHMEMRFGTVEDGRVCLNDAGAMAAATWDATSERYPGVALDAFVIMPNHMHAIVCLGVDPAISSSGVTLSRIIQSFKSLSTVAHTRGVKEGRYPPYDRVL